MTSKTLPPASGTTLSVPEALAAFAAAETSPGNRHKALTALITAKQLPKGADDPLVLQGRSHLLSLALATDQSGDRLLGIAESVRLAQVVRRWASELARDLAPAFAQPLPPMRLLADADDRLNLARACAQADAPWLAAYLAQAIAEEEVGEKARAECVGALFARAPSLSQALAWLADAFEAIRPDTASPGDTMARRLTRTLSAVRAVLSDNELDAGEELGKALHRLVAGPLANVGRPQEEKVQLDLAAEALGAVHDVVRMRLSMVTDPEAYRVVDYCKRLLGSSSWPNELKKPLERLITDVTEALVLLGRQGQCDQPLLDQLNVLTNHAERARAIARQLAERHPELPEDVRHWLEKGRLRSTRPASAAAAEVVAGRADETIGLALQTARELRPVSEGLQAPLAASLEIYEPSLAKPVADALQRVLALATQVEQMAALRGLDLYGTPGQEVEMSAKYFVAIGSAPRQRMTVRQPAVVRLRNDGSLGDVVTKGLVE